MVHSTMDTMTQSHRRFHPGAIASGAARNVAAVAMAATLGVVGIAAATGCTTSDDTAATTNAPTTTVETSPTTDNGATDIAPDDAASATVQEFMEARVAGSGAEKFLGAGAGDAFEAAGGLYGLTGFTVVAFNAADANSYEIAVEVVDSDGATREETLFVGWGQPADGAGPAGDPAGQGETMVIRGADVS
jgi:hypothetical protein